MERADDFGGTSQYSHEVDRDETSFIGHCTLDWMNPIGPAAIAQVLGALGAPATALDIGCGKAALLREIARRHRTAGIGIDRSPWVIAAARSAIARDGLNDRVTLLRGDAREQLAICGQQTFDVVACLGASHALTSLAETIAKLAPFVRPRDSAHTERGGRLVLGEGYWRREPTAAYLAATGIEREELRPLGELTASIESAGLVIERTVTATQADFDRYEETYAANLERFATAHEHDGTDASAVIRARIRPWFEAFCADRTRRSDGTEGSAMGFAVMVAPGERMKDEG